MGEEADDYDFDILGGGGGSEHERVMEWETGLPGADELTPLSQPLVPPGLAAAFRIPPEPGRTLLDLHRASAATVSRLRRASSSSSSSFPPFPAGGNGGSAPSSKAAAAAMDDADSSAAPVEAEAEASAGAAVKRPRLVWTPQLHKRFVDVVAHLGIKNAVPKTIMQLMNVDGLTRENVASHLQKYRLYVKRMQGLSNEGSSPSDHIFASTPVPQSLHEPQAQVPVPYAAPAAAMYHPVPMGMAVGMVPMNGGHGHHHNGHAVYNGYGHGHGHGVSYLQYHHGDK